MRHNIYALPYMSIPTDQHNTEKIIKHQAASDHLANERTMLAWVRTGIGIIAFGFAVVKFSLFVKQVQLALGLSHNGAIPKSHGYSSAIGIALVGVGAITLLLSYLRYRRTEKQLTEGTYHHSPLLIVLLTGFIFIISLVLMVYLAETA